ncbi:MAG: NAD(P)H-binding protein, partial [Deltaproteobacteria bacterium]|nr:NAD(P)H-binding protein [Kofleriaceae bacterium]
MSTIAVAGGTGALGRRVIDRALTAGHTVRLLTRDPARIPADLRGRVTPVVGDARDGRAAVELAQGADVLFSCAGASVMMERGRGWRGYGAVDTPLNTALVDAAVAGGRPRVVYVSVFHTPAMRRLAYVDAHERVVERVVASGLPHAIVRPTGFFSAVTASYLGLARSGALPEIGDGSARTNPIGDDDLAAVCLAAIESDEPALAVDAGGPDVVTRHAIAEMAFAAARTEPRYRRVPPWL